MRNVVGKRALLLLLREGADGTLQMAPIFEKDAIVFSSTVHKDEIGKLSNHWKSSKAKPAVELQQNAF